MNEPLIGLVGADDPLHPLGELLQLLENIWGKRVVF
jgi:hypothetical protein